MDNENAPNGDENLSITIGALSSACGIPISTIRTWERRYGFPCPDRTPGNQRLYNPVIIEQMKLIQHALECGHRPGQIVPLTIEQLKQLVDSSAPSSPPPIDDEIKRWVEAAKQLDGSFIEGAFQQSCRMLGVERFLIERVSPFLQAIGTEWASGKLQIFHEHFASERLHDFLTSTWRPLSNHSKGPYMVCATLPGEQHDLGLHMATTIAALHDFQILFLGPKTPLEEMINCASQVNATAILVSISIASDLRRAHNMLKDLYSDLPKNIDLVVGGAGASPSIPGVVFIENLAQFSSWALQKKQLVQQSRNY